MTEPPPRGNFSATANQMEIYDCYVEDLAKQVSVVYICGCEHALGHTDIHTNVHISPLTLLGVCCIRMYIHTYVYVYI